MPTSASLLRFGLENSGDLRPQTAGQAWPLVRESCQSAHQTPAEQEVSIHRVFCSSATVSTGGGAFSRAC